MGDDGKAFFRKAEKRWYWITKDCQELSIKPSWRPNAIHWSCKVSMVTKKIDTTNFRRIMVRQIIEMFIWWCDLFKWDPKFSFPTLKWRSSCWSTTDKERNLELSRNYGIDRCRKSRRRIRMCSKITFIFWAIFQRN